MNKHDLLKLRLRRYISLTQLRSIASDYLPEESLYFLHPEQYKGKMAFLMEFESCHLVEKNYDALLDKVNAYLPS